MLSSFVEGLIKGTNAAQLTEIFLLVLLFVFFVSLWWKYKEQHVVFTSYTPTLLTSLGILGTFTGIVSGLLEFNTNDIDGSIGPLLGGLKTAFITSLIGMLLSIIFKAIVSTGMLKSKSVETLTEEEVGAADLYQVMKLQVDGINELKKAISGSDESSLVGQIKLMRSDISDNHRNINKHLMLTAESVSELNRTAGNQQQNFKEFEDRLWIKLQDFADMLSKSATEQVIDALRQVIKDFNDNLIEQFGDNFKQLNEAVLKLVEWQENYKQQLVSMIGQYELGVEAISKTEASVTHISEEAKVIPITMNELKEVVQVNQHQINELNRHLEAFKDIRDKAVMAVPEIRGQIDHAIEGAKAANDVLAKGMQESADRMSEVLIEGTDVFKDSVRQSNAALVESAQTTANSSEEIKNQFSSAIEDINNNMRNLVDELLKGGESLNSNYQNASKTLIDDTREISTTFSSGMEEMRRELEKTITDHAVEHRQQADRVFAGLEKSIEEALSNTAESVQKQVDMIDKTAEDQIQKVMTAMGSALASISNKFTDDYSQLVSRMNDVVNNNGAQR
jgi:hypothetical protein